METQCFIGFREAILARVFKQPEIAQFQSALPVAGKPVMGFIDGYVDRPEIYTSTRDGR
jgi:hypothetical protein